MAKEPAVFFALWCLFSFAGCTAVRLSPPPMATVTGVPGPFFPGQILDLREGKAIPFEQLIERVHSKDLIFVGEIHDNPEHHLLQVQILQALLSREGPLSVAMEFFEMTKQHVLDRYIQGDMKESEFLKEADWKGGWGYDFALYRPLLLLARDRGVPVLAINAPREIVRKVAREGLQGLTPLEREQLPAEIDLTDQAHQDSLRQVYEQHHRQDLKRFDYFYEAQCVWEETMAHHIAAHLREEKRKVVVFAGNGHILRRFGIPDRAVRRHPASMVTIVPFPLDGKVTIERDAADYVWLTPDYPRRLRVSEGMAPRAGSTRQEAP